MGTQNPYSRRVHAPRVRHDPGRGAPPSFFIFVPSLPPLITVGRRVRVYTRDRFVKITPRHITGGDCSVASYGSAHVYRYGNRERFVVRVFWGHSERDYAVTEKNRKAFVSAEFADIDAVFARGKHSCAHSVLISRYAGWDWSETLRTAARSTCFLGCSDRYAAGFLRELSLGSNYERFEV